MRVQRYNFLLNCLRFTFQKIYVFLSFEKREDVETKKSFIFTKARSACLNALTYKRIQQ